MTEENILPVGVCILPEQFKNSGRSVSYPNYLNEILEHAGLCYSKIDFDKLPESLPHLRILITTGEVSLPEDYKSKIKNWIFEGGNWISIAGICGLGDILGAEAEVSSWQNGICPLGEGYISPIEKNHPILSHIEHPLHFFGGLSAKTVFGKARAGILDAHGRPTKKAGIVENAYGKGRTIFIGTDIAGSAVRIQQGIGVTRDRVSAPDGTVNAEDYILKSDDGSVLDWILDRQPLPNYQELKIFLQPVADCLKEILLRSIFLSGTVKQYNYSASVALSAKP